MRTAVALALALLTASGAVPTTTARAPGRPGPGDKGPAVGSIAPEPGFRGWIRREGSSDRTLADLRGQVVLVHTFAWDCASCLRVGIPLVVDLVEANADRGLTAVSVTTAAYPDETQEVLERFRVRHPVATELPWGSENPYVDASVNPITYVFVIGRNGEVAWRGDPSSQLDDCLEAVARALEEPSGRGFDRPLHPELAEAVRLYFAGDWDKARKAAEKAEKKHARSNKEEPAAIASDARLLLARIAEVEGGLLSGLEEALSARDGERIARLRDEIETLSPKSDVAAKAGTLLAGLDQDAELAESVELAESWLQVASTRPALFPVRADKVVSKFAKELRRFVERNPESPYRQRAEAWLARWDEVHGDE